MKQHPAEARALVAAGGLTALLIAQARAAESRRPDRLFRDPFAEQFVAAAGAAFDPRSPEFADLLRLRGDYIAVRTRFFDDYLADAGRAGCRQIVLLAAGLDARAFRLAWPGGTTLFELDLPEVMSFKQAVLSAQPVTPNCGRVVVPADLRADWPQALLASGLRSDQPAAWLLEGILMYLAEDERERLLSQLGGLASPGSRLALDHRGLALSDATAPSADRIDAGGGDEAQNLTSTDVQAARLGVRIPLTNDRNSLPDLGRWLASHGWRAQVYNAGERFARYGRVTEGRVADAAAQLWLSRAERI